jgi:hypothetical protein
MKREAANPSLEGKDKGRAAALTAAGLGFQPPNVIAHMRDQKHAHCEPIPFFSQEEKRWEKRLTARSGMLTMPRKSMKKIGS